MDCVIVNVPAIRQAWRVVPVGGEQPEDIGGRGQMPVLAMDRKGRRKISIWIAIGGIEANPAFSLPR
jgi:hypothetical protein